MISTKWIAITIQGVLLFLTTQPNIFTADYLIRTKNFGLRISIVLTPAFAVKRGKGSDPKDYAGFLPELLAELKNRNGIQSVYELYPAENNEIGHKTSDGNWTGLIQEVRTNISDFGVGPILTTVGHQGAVVLSKPWATGVELTLVVKKSSNVTSLRDAINKIVNFYVVNGSVEQDKLQSVSRQQGSSDISTLHNRITPLTRSVTDILYTVSREDQGAALVLNSEEARYHVTHDYCNRLESIPNFQPLGNYAFAFPPRAGPLLDQLNAVLEKMTKDGSLDTLKDKTLGVPGMCSDAAFLYPGTAVTFLLAAAVGHLRF